MFAVDIFDRKGFAVGSFGRACTGFVMLVTWLVCLDPKSSTVLGG